VFFVSLHGFCVTPQKSILQTALVAQSKAPNITDAQGKKQGQWLKMDPENKFKLYSGTFKDDLPQGTFLFYYPNSDTVKTQMKYGKDPKVGYAIMYHMTGKIMGKGKYVNEQKDSIWNFYDDMGTLLSTDFYLKGNKEGKSKVFYPSGVLSEEKNYKFAKLEGPFKQYYFDKKLKGEGAYKNDGLHGKVTYYYPNGVAAAQGNYVLGVKTGVWMYKEKDGKLKDKEVWDNGHQLNAKQTEEYFKKNKAAATTEKPKDKPKSTK